MILSFYEGLFKKRLRWSTFLESLCIFCFSLHPKHAVRGYPFLFSCFQVCLWEVNLLHLFPDGVMIKSTPPVNAEGFIRASPDDTVSLICEIPDINLKEEELKWQRNGAAVSLNDQNKKTGSALCITPVIPEDHAATFTCSLAKNSTDSASVTLEVLCESIYQPFYWYF